MILATGLWVGALIRRAEQGGGFATVGRKGDERAGAVLVKTLDRRSGEARLFVEAVGRDGETLWISPLASRLEDDVDAYAARAARIDPDLWVVEIEDADGARFLTERVDRSG